MDDLFAVDVYDPLFDLSVPIVRDIDERIAEILASGTGKLDMGAWHRDTVTHCRAGWAIVLAGDSGFELEQRVGTYEAAIRIYRASAGYCPDFYASTDDALHDLQTRTAR